jgi:hypothetical protein
MSSSTRAKLVASNPAPATQFFDVMIHAFLDIIVHPGKQLRLFSKCTTYTEQSKLRDKVHCIVICCYG